VGGAYDTTAPAPPPPPPPVTLAIVTRTARPAPTPGALAHVTSASDSTTQPDAVCTNEASAGVAASSAGGSAHTAGAA
jgi:hypothetical protein